MLVSPQHRLVLHTATFLVWALAASCAGYWILQVTSNPGPAERAVADAVGAPTGVPSEAGALARLLGATAPQATTVASNSSRFSLKGVVSGALGNEAALIVIDDKPARAFRVGSVVEDGLILQSARARQVTLSAKSGGPAVMTLDMPPLVK